jgi:carbonic anhydrase
MGTVFQEVLAANAAYANDFGDKSRLTIPPARRFAILTCIDARLDPAKFAGLAEGDAHVIRNAGGRASDDAIRSLVISYKLLGTREWFVIHHTDCGMQTFTDEKMRSLLASSLDTARLTANGWEDVGQSQGSTEAQYIDWLTFRNLEKSVADDVDRIRRHPLVPDSIPVHGFVYDVRSGLLREVTEEAETRAARARVAAGEPAGGAARDVRGERRVEGSVRSSRHVARRGRAPTSRRAMWMPNSPRPPVPASAPCARCPRAP